MRSVDKKVFSDIFRACFDVGAFQSWIGRLALRLGVFLKKSQSQS